jgi:hypothetical protein
MSDLISPKTTVVRRASAVLIAGLISSAVIGAALGVVWWKLAPRVSVIVKSGETWPVNYQPNEYLGADVAFGALALLAGLGVTIALINMRREHLISTLASSVLSGFVGAALMWFIGTRLGGVDIAGLSGTEEVVVDAPLRLTLPAMIMVWPITASVVVSIVAAADWFSAARKRDHADDTFSI